MQAKLEVSLHPPVDHLVASSDEIRISIAQALRETHLVYDTDHSPPSLTMPIPEAVAQA
jgi:hypothetical protein